MIICMISNLVIIIVILVILVVDIVIVDIISLGDHHRTQAVTISDLNSSTASFRPATDVPHSPCFSTSVVRSLV